MSWGLGLKIIFSILLLISFTELYAKDRKYNQLVFAPNLQEVVLETKYTFQFSKSIWEYLNQEYAKTKIDSEESSLGILYGVSEQFSLGVQASYELSRETVVTSGPASTANGQTRTYQNSGLKDPVLRFIYRVRDRDEGEMSSNLYFNISPKVKNAVAASTSVKGNGARGGTNGTLGTEFGGKFGIFSYSFDFSIDRIGESKSTETKSSAYGLILGRANVQFQAFEKISFRSFLGLGFIEKNKKTFSNGTFIENEDTGFIEVGGAAHFEFLEKGFFFFDFKGDALAKHNVTDETGTHVVEAENNIFYFNFGVAKQF